MRRCLQAGQKPEFAPLNAELGKEIEEKYARLDTTFRNTKEAFKVGEKGLEGVGVGERGDADLFYSLGG